MAKGRKSPRALNRLKELRWLSELDRMWYSHYNWLSEFFPQFIRSTAPHIDYPEGLIRAHGDKCYCYEHKWSSRGIPFPHGVAIYLLTYVNPYQKECRETSRGWVAPDDWVISNYQTFRPFLSKCKLGKWIRAVEVASRHDS